MAVADDDARRAFILSQTVVVAPPLVPELRLHLITDACALWRANERDLERLGLPPPFWGFAWPGGQALARYLLEHPDVVRGKTVLDFGAGCGIEALAALKVGAARAIGADIDPYAPLAMQLNAALNDCAGLNGRAGLETTTADLIDTDDGWDVILAGDMFYDADMARRVSQWLKKLTDRGAKVLLGDPHRGYLEQETALTLSPVARYLAPSDVDVEGQYLKWTAVYAG